MEVAGLNSGIALFDREVKPMGLFVQPRRLGPPARPLIKLGSQRVAAPEPVRRSRRCTGSVYVQRDEADSARRAGAAAGVFSHGASRRVDNGMNR